MKEYKVLVFPAGTEIAFEIHTALRNSKFIHLYGATSVPCHADFLYETCVNGVPFVDAPEFIDSMNAVIDRFGIDFVYPAHDSALLELSMHEDDLHAKVVTSSYFTVRTCRSKLKTYAYLFSHDADYLPRWWSSADRVLDTDFPVFVKPAVGQGAEGAEKIENRDALDRKVADGKEYAICEYLPGREITVDCFTDRHGALRFIGPRTRDRIRAGIAVRSHSIPIEKQVADIAVHLNTHFKFNGAWFFQLKKDRFGLYKLMEVAPRIAGTMGLSRNLGVNMPLLTLYNMLGTDVELAENPVSLVLDRAFISRFHSDVAYVNVYVDFDDTLIVRGKVNPMLIAFLYQAKNKGKNVHLLTRHDGNIFDKLEEHGISASLFDSVICIGKSGKKSCFIHSAASVLIDDSFSERMEVHENSGAYVFDLDMVESLLDWSA